jgi:tRNA(Ile)-lysidine synthase
MAMLHVMATLAASRGISVYAHGVDHGLRKEAASELALAEALATKLGVPFSQSSVTVAPGENLQAEARRQRYQALRARASELGGALIATAHHADDRAETVLLRILRGSGMFGLGVLSAKEGDRLRPLLRARRADIRAHLERHAIAFATDPSNQNTKYSRVKVRLEVLPLLESMSPNIVNHLCQLADEACSHRQGDKASSPGALGRRQRMAIEHAIASRALGFELPISGGLELRLERRREEKTQKHRPSSAT